MTYPDFAGNVLKPLRGKERKRHELLWRVNILRAKQQQQLDSVKEMRKRVHKLIVELEKEENDERVS